MPQWTTYHLTPKPGAGFHFGLRGLEQESSASHCPSDTLFAALVATAANLNGDAGARAFTKPFEDENREPPWLLTSAFPRAGNLPLYPFPFVRVELTEKPGQRKLFKNLRYVSPAIFARIINRQPLDEYADKEKEKGVFLQRGQVWLTVDEIDALPGAWRELTPNDVKKRKGWRKWLTGEEGRQWLREQKVWQSTPVDRVTVDRVASASAIYRIGRTVYAPGCGLWFGAQWPDGIDTGAQTQLETLLSYLGDRGLGGERSVGYGQFTWETGALPNLPGHAPDGPALTLARYLPRKEELPAVLQGDDASYRLAAVAGWLNAPGHRAQRRRQVRVLTEGSVFQTSGAGPWGRLADVCPDGWNSHSIWRYGYACPVGVKRGGENAKAHTTL
ncbi:MAG: type III-A CRISPR-associated RAMP protein Csm4 [Anaerolineaceae bacterium 4572_32.1]|nr:MAG: type III-A CRISPR-associated RAMP protein Csm4 [Anaerolineaceae bacterium 4572_32.1]HEY73861.1 type III-A CRISPR-associated RAMP protein Csm4 [Thermoflexia bacterium]